MIRVFTELIASPYSEPEFLDVVFATHRYFSSSVDLLQKLLAVVAPLKDGTAQWQRNVVLT